MLTTIQKGKEYAILQEAVELCVLSKKPSDKDLKSLEDAFNAISLQSAKNIHKQYAAAALAAL